MLIVIVSHLITCGALFTHSALRRPEYCAGKFVDIKSNKLVSISLQ